MIDAVVFQLNDGCREIANESEDFLMAKFKHLLVVQSIFCLNQRFSGIKVLKGMLADILFAEPAILLKAHVEGWILNVVLDAVAQC